MRGEGTVQPFGEFGLFTNEYADTAALSDSVYYSNSMQIWKDYSNSSTVNMYIQGDLSGINFKKLIRQGGGSFSGTFTVTDGSARYCDVNVFTNLPPLIVTGSLDVKTQVVTLRIKGKVYF
jgi:hypothetical protein